MMNLFEKASEYSIDAHKGQTRKDGSIYVLHPFEVASIAGTITFDDEVLAAAVLHDVPEECKIDPKVIGEKFGERIGNIVALATEPRYPELPRDRSWKLRKIEALRRLNTCDDIGFKIVYLSDKLANIRALYRDFEKEGYDAFNKFNVKDAKEQAWYYYSVLDGLEELSKTDAYKEYKYLIDIIFKNKKK